MPLNRHSRRYWKSSTGPTARPLGPKARYRKTCVCYSFVKRDQLSFCASLGENSPMGVMRVAVLESAGDCTPAMAAQVETEDVSAPRTEEHTSELQSLMRISYAVFYLKNKKNRQSIQTEIQHS